VLGSGLYMSPEQMKSAKNVDFRTDVYALGICLYELLTHTQPFVAESFSELVMKVNLEPPDPVRRHRPDVSEELSAVIEKAFARHPEERYQSVIELVKALAPFAAPESQPAIDAVLRVNKVSRPDLAQLVDDLRLGSMRPPPGSIPPPSRTSAMPGSIPPPSIPPTPASTALVPTDSAVTAPTAPSIRTPGTMLPKIVIAASALVILAAGFAVWRARRDTGGDPPAMLPTYEPPASVQPVDTTPKVVVPDPPPPPMASASVTPPTPSASASAKKVPRIVRPPADCQNGFRLDPATKLRVPCQ
jgi:eukaryotic-like serine/threonine-protein kinase